MPGEYAHCDERKSERFHNILGFIPPPSKTDVLSFFLVPSAGAMPSLIAALWPGSRADFQRSNDAAFSRTILIDESLRVPPTTKCSTPPRACSHATARKQYFRKHGLIEAGSNYRNKHRSSFTTEQGASSRTPNSALWIRRRNDAAQP